jgi:hypothetical protein
LEARNLLSFAAPPSALLPAPVNPGRFSVAAADFTGNGKLDLALVTGEGRLSVFPGNGDGSFQAARTVPIPVRDGPELAAGDFTGHGTRDLALSSLTGIDILLGNGDGTFRFGGSFEILPGGAGQEFAISIAVGDFFGDGKQDLVVTEEFGDVVLLRGNGDGTFQRGVAVGTFNPSGFFAAVAGDVNNDGKQDLVVATATTAQLLLGNGDGTFQDPISVNFAAGTPGTVIGVGDFTNDGRLDPVLNTNTAVSVLLNNGDGTFATAPAYATARFPREVVAGDFTGSGLPDLVTADSGGMHLLPNNGDGTFASPVALADGAFGGLIARDFNGDGHLDLAALTRSSEGLQVQVFLGNGDRTFQAPRITDVGSSDFVPEQVVAGDLDGDGKLDLAIVYEDIGTGHFAQSFVTVLLGNGDGTFRVTDTHQVAPRGIPATGLAAADFNGDGHLDLVETNSDGTVNLLLGNGDGSFQDPIALHPGVRPSSITGGNAVAAADLRHNGITDLVVTDAVPTGPDQAVSVLLGNGDGTFQDPVRYQVGTGAGAPLVGDFNGDGIPDLAVLSGDTVSVLRGNGDGTFQDPVSNLAGDIPTSLVAADFNGDGALDLATAGFHSASVTVLLSRNDGPGGSVPGACRARPGRPPRRGRCPLGRHPCGAGARRRERPARGGRRRCRLCRHPAGGGHPAARAGGRRGRHLTPPAPGGSGGRGRRRRAGRPPGGSPVNLIDPAGRGRTGGPGRRTAGRPPGPRPPRPPGGRPAAAARQGGGVACFTFLYD